MHVLSIESHRSESLYRSGLSGLSEVLASVTDIHSALSLQLPKELFSELSYRILGYTGKKEPRYIPLYHQLPSNVKLSLYTQAELCKPVNTYPMARFLTNSKRIAAVMLFANYSKWPSILDKEARLKLYTEYGPWLYKGEGRIPSVVHDFCTLYKVEHRVFRSWPIDILFGSPNLRNREPHKMQFLDAVNCAAAVSYDLVSLSRPSLHSMIENWKKT